MNSRTSSSNGNRGSGKGSDHARRSGGSDGARSAREEKLAALHERLTGAVASLVSGADWVAALRFAARFRTRSFNNTMLIWVQHIEAFELGRVPVPEPTFVAGFKQWQSLGRQVSKGQSGYAILAPVTARFASANPTEAGSWRRLSKFEKPKPGEQVRSRLVGSRPAYVWDVSQTAGDPIPQREMPVLLQGQAPEGLREGLIGLLNVDGFQVSQAGPEVLGAAYGCTNFTTREVVTLETLPPAALVKTLGHELGHVRLHNPADGGGPDRDALSHRGIGEVEAESVALMIAAAHGMDTSNYTLPYVAHWAETVPGREAVDVVAATGERVRRCAASILDELPTAQDGTGDPPGLTRNTTGRAGVETSSPHQPRASAPNQQRARVAGSATAGRAALPKPAVTTSAVPGMADGLGLGGM